MSETSPTPTKPKWASRTLWANAIAFIAAVATAFGFDLGLGVEQQGALVAGIMAIVNGILRLRTNQGLQAAAPATVLALALMLGGCGTVADPTTWRDGADQPKSPTELLADRIVAVPAEYRPLRLCLLSTLAIELMTDRVERFDPDQAEATLGRLVKLQGLVETARAGDPLWINADMADAALTFGRILIDLGQERLADYVLSGLSVQTFVEGARRVSVQTIKGIAMLRDIDAMVARLADGTLAEGQAWAACDARAEANRAVIEALLGVGGGAPT